MGLIQFVDDQLQVAQPAPEARFYIMKREDTLSKIAHAHYGNANQYPRIFAANRALLRDPDELYPGADAAHPPINQRGAAESSLQAKSVAHLADDVTRIMHEEAINDEPCRVSPRTDGGAAANRPDA
jgi:hypothetical protein